MSLRFYFGGSGSGKSTKLQDYVIGRSMQEPDQQFIFLVPDQFTMQVQKEIVVRHPRKGIMNIDVLSFSRLYHRIMEETGSETGLLLDDTGKNLILRRIALEHEDDLAVIGSSMKKIGFIHEVKSVISEFMQYNVSPQDVEKIVEFSSAHGALGRRLEDINKLYRCFLDFLGDHYVTTEEMLDVLARKMPESKILKGSVVIIDGFTGFTPIQKNVVSRLLELCSEVIMTVTVDPAALCPAADVTGLFRLSRKTVAAMEKLAKELGVPREKDVVLEDRPVPRLQESSSLSFLEQEIFRGRKNVYAGRPEEIALAKADSPREEIRYICCKIRELLKEKRYAYRDIAVITGDLERYAPYAEELFPRYDIPLFVDQTRKLVLNPFTEYLKSGLKVIAGNFAIEHVCHFLKSGLTGLEWDEIDRLENYILALRIRGRKKWERMFVRYPKYMKGDMEALEAVNRTREKVLEMLSPLLSLGARESAEAITDELYRFTVQNRIAEKLMEYERKFHEEGDLAREKEYSQIYAYICKLMEQIRGLLGSELVSIDEYSKILEAGITEISIGVIPQEVDYVMMGDMQRSRLKDIKVLFFIGLNDGIIPVSSGSGGIISDMDREFLTGSGYELAPTPRENMYIQKMYLYMTLTKPSKELYLSYAQMDGEGKSIRPSYLVGMVKGLFPEMPEEDIMERDMASRICGEKDCETYLAGLLRRYADLQTSREEKDLLLALYRLCQDADSQRAEMLKEAAFYTHKPKRLGKELAGALYGAVLQNSISRLEQFAGCAFAHFLQYGMCLEDREDYSFEKMDMGNIFHQVLEAFGNKLQEKGWTWTEFTREEGEQLLESVLLDVVNQYGESVVYRDARTSYQITRMRRLLHRAVFTMQYQLKKSNYQPKELEVKFQSVCSLKDMELGLTDEDQMVLRGKIDRLDICERDDRLYVKIVDYKSSSKKIDVVKLYHGTQLQLVVYLDHAMMHMQEKEKEKNQEKNPAKKVLPGAMFYYPILDPMLAEDVEGTDEGIPENEEEKEQREKQEFEDWIHRQLRMSGLYIAEETVMHDLDTSDAADSDVIFMKKKQDGSLAKKGSEGVSENDMTALMEFSRQKVRELGAKIRIGEKNASPLDKERCGYCPFAEICNFDPRIKGFQMQENMVTEKGEAWEAIRSCVPSEKENEKEKEKE